MAIELTGISTPIAGLSWQLTKSEKDAARRVVTFLEDRRLLFGERHMEDERECYGSAGAIRAFLTQEMLDLKKTSPLRHSLQMMRAACRKFMDSGEPGGRGFERHHSYGPDQFGFALGDLRTAIGMHLAVILSQFPMPLEPDLLAILPAQDRDDDDLTSWMPGFGSPDR